jgi:hypothetical protein
MFIVLLLCAVAAAAAAPVTFTIGLLDHSDESPIVCATDGSDCVKEFAFPETARFWIDVPPTYAASIEISPVRSGVCNIANDAYVASEMFSNTLAAFKKARDVLVLAAKNATDAVLVAMLPNCPSSAPAYKRYYVGVSQNDNGLIGNCPTGRFRLRLADSSGVCGVTRDDASCYEGRRSCEFVAKNGGVVRSDLSVGDGWRCCPQALVGQFNTITSTTGCTCSGKSHVSLVGLQPPPIGCYFLFFEKRAAVGKDLVLYCDPTSDYMTAGIDSMPGIGAKQSGTKFNVYFLTASTLRNYRSGSVFSCGYDDCRNVYTDAWSRLVPLAPFRGGPLFVVIKCVSTSGGGDCVFEFGMYEDIRQRIAAVPGGRCEATDFCRKMCGVTTGQCCADCSAADSCGQCPMLPPAVEGGSPPAVAPTPPATPAGTCQTVAFCRDKCGVTGGGISAGSISFGACCADCRPTDLSLTGAGLGCTNTCPAFGVGAAPSWSTPAPVQWMPQPATAPVKTTTTGSECSNAKTDCEARCKAEGGGTVLNHVCSAKNGAVVSQICQCQPGSDGTGLAVLTALHATAFVYATCC